MLWASCANSAPSPSTSNPWPPQTSNPPFPEKPKSLPRMLSYGAGSSLFTLKCSADFQVSPPRKRWPLGFFRLPLRRVAEPLTLGTILGAAPLWFSRVRVLTFLSFHLPLGALLLIPAFATALQVFRRRD